MKKSDFNFNLPEELIAQHPLAERHASRLLCLDKNSGTLADRQFRDFPDFLAPEDLLVFNNTKVIPARLYGVKSTGGKVEILVERILDDNVAIAHMRASKTPKPGAVVHLENQYTCQVQGREGDLFRIKFNANLPLLTLLNEIGHIPLPPYINRADDRFDVERYQSIFGEHAGAVAAPTASLHFDDAIMAKIADKGIATAFVTLHVGSGTFQPVRVQQLSQHVMHKEVFSVPEETAAAITRCKQRGGRVIAIGTTAVRALESVAENGKVIAGAGETAIFITPGYTFQVVDAMLTNFHLPESTLLMLVSAFAGYASVMQAYRHAVAEAYRFFSYGDAMFIYGR